MLFCSQTKFSFILLTNVHYVWGKRLARAGRDSVQTKHYALPFDTYDLLEKTNSSKNYTCL